MAIQKKRKSQTQGKEKRVTSVAESFGNKKEMVARAYSLAEPVCAAEGLELVHVEYQREATGRTLRIYIDKHSGVTLDDCVCISHQLNDIFDVSFENEESYHLEVSSPGFNRPLGKAADFERFKGSKVKIRVSRWISEEGIGKRRNFQGILLGISEGLVTLSIDGKTVGIPFVEIERAHLVNDNGEKRC